MENTARKSIRSIFTPGKHHGQQNPKPWGLWGQMESQAEWDRVQNWFGSTTRPKFQYVSTKDALNKYLHLQAPLLRKVLPVGILGMLVCMRAALMKPHMSKLMYAQSRMTFVQFFHESFPSDSEVETFKTVQILGVLCSLTRKYQNHVFVPSLKYKKKAPKSPFDWIVESPWTQFPPKPSGKRSIQT